MANIGNDTIFEKGRETQEKQKKISSKLLHWC